MPRTSPTFQSFFGLSGCALWQATQAAPMITGPAMRMLLSKIEPDTSTTDVFGSARSATIAPVSKASRLWFSRPLNGRSETKRYLTASLREVISLPSSIDSVAGIGMPPGVLR